jgi:hypothetical protein
VNEKHQAAEAKIKSLAAFTKEADKPWTKKTWKMFG